VSKFCRTSWRLSEEINNWSFIPRSKSWAMEDTFIIHFRLYPKPSILQIKSPSETALERQYGRILECSHRCSFMGNMVERSVGWNQTIWREKITTLLKNARRDRKRNVIPVEKKTLFTFKGNDFCSGTNWSPPWPDLRKAKESAALQTTLSVQICLASVVEIWLNLNELRCSYFRRLDTFGSKMAMGVE
jgi:hypothetical protein